MKRVSRRHADSFTLETLEPRSMMAADLAAAGLTLFSPSSQIDGVRLQPFVFSVLNMGDRRAPIGSTVRFYLSRDAVLDAGDRFLRNSVLPVPVRSGERVAFNKVIKIPSSVDSGTYRILMQVDPEHNVPDTDASNNVTHSAALQVVLNPAVESLDVSKRYLRPGSAVTLTAHNVTNFEDGTGDVKFYIEHPRYLNYIFPRALLGVGTRNGNDFSLTLTGDASWIGDFNTISVEVRKFQGGLANKSVDVQGRNAGPTIGAITFSPQPLVRGQTVSFTAAGVSANTARIVVAFDSNFDGLFQRYPYPNASSYYDTVLVNPTANGTTWSGTFVVPDWFPSVPTRVFVVAFGPTLATRAYSVILTAH